METALATRTTALAELTEAARDFIHAARSENTIRAYRADGTMGHSASEAKIVGVVVKHYPAKVPTFR